MNENIQRVLIDKFQLKVTLTPRESRDTKLLYTNAAGKQRSIPSTASNLSFFTGVSELSLEDEILSIPFTLVPAAGMNTVNIKFELLDEEGERIQTCNANWYSRASMHLTVIPREKSSIDIEVNVGAINSKAGNSLAISNSTNPLNNPINFETSPFKEGVASSNTVITRKRLRPSDKFIQPIKKFKEGGEAFARYESMDIRELAKLANSHNSHAQEEIIIRCLKQGVSPLIKKLITPFSWDEIQLKALEDERYVFLLLRFLDQTTGFPLDIRIVRKVIADATAGGILAQCNLGFMYSNGQGVDRDDKQAFEWYSKSAYQGNAIAQNNLGNMYRDRQGVDRDYKQAFEWFEKAAHQGNAQAQCSLGFVYSNGQGVDRDYKQAFEWYSKAAHQGEPNAQSNLGFMYYNGQGVDRDYKQAFEWFEKAAHQGNALAQCSLGFMYKHGQGVDR
ncbi:MAG: tetratricopeptide repeat protein, partial [Candidatus Amoebophilus sp.]